MMSALTRAPPATSLSGASVVPIGFDEKNFLCFFDMPLCASLLPAKGCGRSPKPRVGVKDKRPPCPVSVAQGEAPHRALGLSIAQEDQHCAGPSIAVPGMITQWRLCVCFQTARALGLSTVPHSFEQGLYCGRTSTTIRLSTSYLGDIRSMKRLLTIVAISAVVPLSGIAQTEEFPA